jgi:hypothetical protein
MDPGGSPENAIDAIQTAQRPLVVNDFNVGTSKSEFVELAATTSSLDDAALKRHNELMDSMSSGNLIARRQPARDPENGCGVGNARTTFGSGVHIGKGNFLTAWHNTNGKLDFLEGGFADQFHVYFEANNGSWTSYLNGGSQGAGAEGIVPEEAGSTHIGQESPYLSMRLWSLGFEEMAHRIPGGNQPRNDAAQSTRQGMRTWPMGLKDTLAQIDTADRKVRGQDIALLGSVKKPIPNNLSSIQQPFTHFGPPIEHFVHPGVFFGRTLYHRFDECFTPPDGEYPGEAFGKRLGLFHQNIWKDASSGIKGALHSLEGYTDATGITKANCTNSLNLGYCSDNGVPLDLDFDRCVKTTLDARPQSSGGALITSRGRDGCAVVDREDPDYNEAAERKWLPYKSVAVGVLSAAFANPAELADNWFGEANVRSPNEDQYTDLATTDGYTIFAALDAEFQELTPNRNTNPDTDDDTPVGTPAGQQLYCELLNVPQDGCAIYDTTDAIHGGNNVPPLADLTNYARANEDNLDGDTNVFELCEYSTLSDSERSVLRADLGEDGWAGSNIGYLTGLSGFGTSTSILEKPGYLSGLGTICSPWSNLSWFDNWDMSYHRPVHHDRESSVGRYNYFSSVADFIHASAELRAMRDRITDVMKEVVRPPSYKTCPSNMVMNGLQFHWKNDGTERYIASIDKIYCLTPDANQARILEKDPSAKKHFEKLAEWRVTPSVAPLAQTEIFRSDSARIDPFERVVGSNMTYPFGSFDYDISPNIGPSGAVYGHSDYTVDEIRCPVKPRLLSPGRTAGTLAVGVVLDRDASKRVTNLRLFCLQQP